MMNLLFWAINIATVIVVYVWWIRPILLKTPALAGLAKTEETYFAAIKVKLAGIKQFLVSALLYLAGASVTMHDFIAPYLTGMDVTPILPKIVRNIPPEAWPFILVGITALMDYFRRLCNEPDKKAG